MRILAICGSLDVASSNAALLDHASRATSGGDSIVVHEALDGLPYFSPDRDRDGGATPVAVARLREAVKTADAVVIATPEYAGGMPGTLKNALDWLVGSGELYGKPAVVVSAAPSSERGKGARESVELTLRMQGARVCDSFTVAVRRGAGPGDVTAWADELVVRTIGALASCAGATAGEPAGPVEHRPPH